jgi:hypothetical protein
VVSFHETVSAFKGGNVTGTIWNSCLWQKHRTQKNECCIFLRSIFLPIQLVWVCMEASGTESLRARDMRAVLEFFFPSLRKNAFEW